MRKTKEQKGITLIALIITIVVLLILAVVAIGAVQDDGILNHAKNARDEYGKAQVNENTTLGEYLSKIEANLPENSGVEEKPNEDENAEDNSGKDKLVGDTTMEEAQSDSMLTKTVNSNVIDKYNNKITVPSGFKILVDNTTGYTSETIDVTKGIVITDGTNEFVWVPVGDIYYSEKQYKTIPLGRYYNFTANNEGKYTPTQEAKDYATLKEISSRYTEDTEKNHNSTYENVIAKDIGEFVTSATTKGGYYLARYEAGVTNYDESKTITTNSNNEKNWTGYVAEDGKKLQLVSKKNAQVWNYITQNKASELSRNMYTSNNFTSDLVNSYAWDTAIIFIQSFGTRSDYANGSYNSVGIVKAGTTPDKQCNIHEMACNVRELSTESTEFTYNNKFYSCVSRGGYRYEYEGQYDLYPTNGRIVRTGYDAYDGEAFRTILYVTL